MSGWFVFMRAEAGALGESRTWVYATGLFGFTLLITFALRHARPE
jgi:TRAP-type C4-dicarboxylate transport system permease small subunit